VVGLRNKVLTWGSVGMGIPMGIPVGIPVGMGWIWGLKCHPHGSPVAHTKPCIKFEVSSSSSFKDMFDRMPKIVGSRDLGHANFQGKLFVRLIGIPLYKAAYQM